MKAKEFLATIWAKQGLKCLVQVLPANAKYRKPYYKHYFYPSTDAAIEAIEQFTARGVTLYHACATFSADQRTQANALLVKSFWADIDCGEGKPYASQKEGVVAIQAFAKEVGLPLPMILSSGRGIHCYWTLNDEIPAEQWTATAIQFKQVMRHQKFQADPSRTADVASILRPVGSKNFKDPANPKDVRVIKAPTPMDYAVFQGLIKSYLDTHDILPEQPLAKGTGLNSDLSGGQEFPPSSAYKIADQCPQIANIRDTRGMVSEPIWYAGIGVLKHTLEGEAVIHEWSSGHPDYDADDTDAKIAQWQSGPAICSRFSDHNPSLCEGCPHSGKIKSPITLGYKPEPPIEQSTIRNDVTGEIEFEMPEALVSNFRVMNGQLSGFSMKTVTDKDTGDTKPVPSWDAFCDTVFYPIGYHRGEEGYALHMRAPSQHNKPARDFELLCSEIGQGGAKLFASLGKHQIVAIHGEKKNMEAYLTKWHDTVKKAVEELQQYQHYGWQDDEAFLVGNRLYQPNGTVKEVLLDKNAASMAKHFSVEGSVAEWRNIINTAYNYPNQEQYQFIVCAGFAAPLVHLLRDFNGTVINMLSYKSGRGKTTVQRAAMSIWAKPSHLFSFEQTTWNALLSNIGTMHSLPVFVDEFTNAQPHDISSFVYSISTGEGKKRLNQAGELRTNTSGWETLVGCSANRSMVSTVAAGKSNPEAEIARVIEYEFEIVSKMKDMEAAELLRRLHENHGAVGDQFARWLVVPKNQEYARELILKVQEKITNEAKLTVVHRFWAQGMAAVIAAGIIAKQLEYIDFDMKLLTGWVVRKLLTMCDTAEENTMSLIEMFGQLLTDLGPNMLVTDNWGDMRSGKAAYVYREPKNILAGRVVEETNEMYLSCTAIRRWCKDNQGDYQGMLAAAQKAGWAQAESVNRTLTKGTAIPSSPLRCWVLNVKALSGEGVMPEVVRHLHSITKETANGTSH